jgi:hypothetical protein
VGSAWYIIQGNIDLATTTTSGITRIATDTETNAGSENFAYVTPSTLRGGVRNTTLTGYAVGSDTALAATDTVLGAFGKVQGQLNAKVTGSGVAGQVSFWSGTTTQAGDSGFVWDNVNKRLGIGTSTPLTKLDIRGTSATTDSTLQIIGTGISTLILGQNADGGVIRGQGGNNVLSFWTGGSGNDAASGSGTERMRITSAGNVGIGATAPSRLLHVAGAIRITGTAAPASPAAGDQYFDSGTNRMRFRDGTSSWIDMGMFWESAAW